MDAQTLLAFMQEAGKLKVMPRTGWLLRGIKHPESIAEHCYRTTLLAMVLSDLLIEHGIDLDSARVMKIALLHDIAESQVGDIPHPAMRYIPDEVKENAERGAMEDIFASFGALGKHYVALWEEYELAQTLESQVVKIADKLELLIQAYEYEKVGFQSLEDFWENLLSYPLFQDYPLVQAVVNLLAERRVALPYRER
jgi:putative hydrolases of HD superfamily